MLHEITLNYALIMAVSAEDWKRYIFSFRLFSLLFLMGILKCFFFFRKILYFRNIKIARILLSGRHF